MLLDPDSQGVCCEVRPQLVVQQLVEYRLLLLLLSRLDVMLGTFLPVAAPVPSTCNDNRTMVMI